jgi:hypothetical protein
MRYSKSLKPEYLAKTIVPCLAFLFIASSLSSQNQPGDLKLLDWKPVSQMVVKETKIMKPKFPVIDIHNHLRNLDKAELYLEEMDKAGVWKCVSLDGTSENDFYKEHLKASQAVSKIAFCYSSGLISVKSMNLILEKMKPASLKKL